MNTLAALLDSANHLPEQRRASELARSDYKFKADLVQARIDAKLTQLQVAEMLGISQPTVSEFERYDSDPKLSTIRRYAHAIGVLVGHSVLPDKGDLREGQTWHTISFRVDMPVRMRNVSTPREMGVKVSYKAVSQITDFALAA